jgi:chemotaxis signal transduction protein
LIVDDVDNVLNLSAEQQLGYNVGSSQYVKGVARLDDRILLLLEPDLL